MVRPQPTGRSSDAILQTLKWVRKQNFSPVPLHHRSKAAISRSYIDPDYTPPSNDLWEANEYGLGIVTGPKHRGPIDVDLDCEEALFFAPRLLPPTGAIFGRASKPKSHYLYRVDSTDFRKNAFLDPLREGEATIVELRGDGGHQTVFPGSLHEATGEMIEWQGELAFPEVPILDGAVLIRAANKIAIATLISRYMWDPGYHNEPCKHLSGLLFHLKWEQEEAEQIIQAVMDYTGDRDRSRIPTVRATYRRGNEGRKISGAGVLKKQLKKEIHPAVDKILEWAGSPTAGLLHDYNERFAVVLLEGKFRIADADVKAGEFPTFYQKDDFVNMTAADYAPEPDERGKRVSKARYWLASPDRLQYRSVDFLPGVEDPPSKVFNLWTGWSVKPDPAGSCKAWLTLLKETVCGGDKQLNTWMLHWFANILREPMNKSLTAPVIIGPEGAGKSLLLGYFGRILGSSYVTVTKEEHVYGRFNKHVASALLLHSEEALYGGEKKHAGIIRSLITDEFTIFEQKGVDARHVRSYLRLVLTSNELHAAPAKPGDRRYTVVLMEDRKASDRLVSEVLKELHEGGGPAALHHYLLEMDYNPQLPKTNVKNEALIDMKRTNMTAFENWWHDTLQNGHVLPDMLAWATQPEREDWPEIVSSNALHVAMTLALQARGVRMVPSETLMALQLNKFTGRKLTRSRKRFENPLADGTPQLVRNLGERQYTILNLPDLNTCRKAFEAYLGQEITWPEPDEEEEKKEKDRRRF